MEINWPQLLVNAISTGGAVWLALRVELRWLRADVNRHEEEIRALRVQPQRG
jgi:hypothetical protein